MNRDSYFGWMKKCRCIPIVIVLVVLPAVLVWAEGYSRGETHAMDVGLRPRDWVALVFCALGFLYLVKSRLRYDIRLFVLGLAFFTFGIFSALPFGRLASAMALHPSPVCAITKPFLFLQSGYSIPAGFFILIGFMGILSIIGNKLFCGWSCPIGAIQEIVHRIPLPKGLKAKIPFKTTNLIRVLLFLLFLIIAFSARMDMYDYVNPFEALHWNLQIFMMTVFCIVLAASLFVYRPFCYFICPAGLFTWVLEHLSIVRVKLNKNACDECQRCVKKSPCPTVPAILKGKRSRPDCHACGICIEACPKHALEFRT